MVSSSSSCSGSGSSGIGSSGIRPSATPRFSLQAFWPLRHLALSTSAPGLEHHGLRTITRRLLLAGPCFAVAGATLVASFPGPAVVQCEAPAVATETALARNGAHTGKGTRPRWRRWLTVLWRVGVFFCCLTPAFIVAPACWLVWAHGGEDFFWYLLLRGLQWHGPAAIKFAQWASTRPDLLPATFITHFSKLQSQVRPHSLEDTEKALTEAFGPQWFEEIEIDAEPIGSGCIAQVYMGRLLPRVGRSANLASRRDVVLKVMHPAAQNSVSMDLEALQLLVDTLEAWIPATKYLAVSEVVAHFGDFLLPQTDLRIEAANLDKFAKNFLFRQNGRGLKVVFPEVLRPYVASNVLMETFEEGVNLGKMLDGRCGPDSAFSGISYTEVRERVGKLCLDTFLQMLFKDNFVHGDMHPGNILVRVNRDAGGRSGAPDAEKRAWDPELVVLDAGLAVQMTRKDRRDFVDLFYAIVMNQGRRAGQLMVERSPGCRDEVIDEGGFVRGIDELITQMRDAGVMLGKLKFGEMFARMLGLACTHKVKLETSFVSVAVSIIVLEGVGRQLAPLVDLVTLATPLLAEADKEGMCARVTTAFEEDHSML